MFSNGTICKKVLCKSDIWFEVEMRTHTDKDALAQTQKVVFPYSEEN